MPKHYRFSPSSMERIMACPGSVMGDVPERPPSEYSEEGDKAHELAADMLRGKGDNTPKDQEMIDGVRVYTNFINETIRSNDVLDEMVETQLVSESIPDFGGTLDYCAVFKEDNRAWLVIVDLKFGKGVPVAVERNKQLLSYMVLAAEKYPNLKHFRMTIVQPRTGSGKPETVEVTAAEIEEHESRVRAVIQEILEADEKGVDPESMRHPGPHCRWCPWAEPLRCQALYDLNMEAIQAQFPPLDEEEETEVDDVWVKRWIKLYESAEIITGLLKEIPKWLLKEMESGKEIPGYKAVPSKGRTTWVDDDLVVKKLQRKIGKKNLFTPKLKSPTQLRKEGHGDLIDKHELAYRPTLPPKVVPISDKRNAIVFKTPEEEFPITLQAFLED